MSKKAQVFAEKIQILLIIGVCVMRLTFNDATLFYTFKYDDGQIILI